MRVAPISDHLHTKPYQVAISLKKEPPFRKWDHKGTIHAVSPKAAAFQAHQAHKSKDGKGEIVSEGVRDNRIIYEFSDGIFVMVGL
jgi:hypothetical protein